MSNGLESYSANQLTSFTRPMQDAISAGKFTPSKLALEADAYIRSTSPETHPDQYTFLGGMGNVYTGPAAIYTSASEYTSWVNSQLADAFDAPPGTEPTPPPPPPASVVTNVITGSGIGETPDDVTEQDINALYQQYLGRDAKQAGLDYWMQSIESGAKLEDVEYNISISNEAKQFQLDQADLNVTAQDINALYQQYLGRDAEQSGLDYWFGSIEQGATLDDVEYNISISDEAKQFRLDQTDMLEDTTAEDTTDDPIADGDAADTGDKDSYTVITSRAKGGANNPFGGSATSNTTSQLVEMTEQELRQEFKDSGQLQDQFGSFENYMGYIKDSQEWVQSADWMLANPEYRPSDIEFLVLRGEDIRLGPDQREQTEQKIISDRQNARQSGYQQWMNEGADILQKWGIQDTIYNDDGDQFKWTGSGYQKTIKVDDHADFGDYFKAVMTSVVTSALTYGAGALIGSIPSVAQVTNTVMNGLPPQFASIIGASQDGMSILSGVVNAASSAYSAGQDTGEAARDYIDQFGGNLISSLTDIGAGEAVGIENDDGTTTYSVYGTLPAGYIWDETRNLVIHQETGTEYGVDVSPYGIRVTLPNIEPKTEDGGGGSGGGGDTATDAGADAAADSSAGADAAAGGDAASLPGGGVDAGGTGGAEDPSGSTGIETTSTGAGSPIIWTESNPWENDPEGVFGGFILVNQDGEWGKSGTSRVQIEGTGVVIDIDWENGTYTSDYVFGSQDPTPVDDGLDTTQTDDAVTGGGDATGAGGDGTDGDGTEGDGDETGDFSGLLGGLLGGGDGAGGSVATTGDAGATSGAATGGAGDAAGGGATGGTGGSGGADVTTGGTSAGTSTGGVTSGDVVAGGATDGDVAAGGDQVAGGTQPGAGTDGGLGDGVGTGDGAGTGTGSGTGTGAGTGAGTGDGTGDGSGDGSGDGFGDGLGLGFGLLAGGGATDASFSPFMTGISYEPLRLEGLSFQQKDYNRELEQMMRELSQPMLTNTKGVA